MQLRQQLQQLRRQAPSWALSLALHLAILTAAGMITWIVLVPPPADRVLALSEADFAPSGLGGEGGPGGDGRPGGGSQTARPGSASEQETAGGLALALAPPAPAPSALAAPAIQAAPAGISAFASPAGPPGKALADQLLARSGDGGGPGAGGGPGSGLGLPIGPGSGFGGLVSELRGKGLDVALVIDATDSMSPYIDQGKKRLQDVIDVISHLVPGSRFGVVAYKDYGDDYGPSAVKFMPLSADHQATGKFLDSIVAGGGGDEPEPVNQAVAAATDVAKMQWGPGRKWVVILVGDSSIHPSGRQDALDKARDFAVKYRGAISVIDVGGSGQQGKERKGVQADLAAVAEAGGGSSFLLRDREAFWRHLIISVFGQRYEKDVNTIIQVLVQKD
jgi:hypothetical protein